MSATWATKYRPTSSEGLVGSALDMYRAFDNIQHAILHSKEAGTGKTTLAHVLANEKGWPIHVFNASSKKTRGIGFVEEELLPLTRMGMREQIILLDEADQLTPEAQSALKGVIENSQGYFILTCNDLSKVSNFLRSRCLDIPFYPIPKADILKRLEYICGAENVACTMSQLEMIADAHPGDLRNCINALQAFSSYQDPLEAVKFLHSLSDNEFNTPAFLKLCFKEKSFDQAYSMILSNTPRVRDTIRFIFNYAVNSDAAVKSKIRVIDAAIDAERDLIDGVDPDITTANFVRILIEG